MSTFDPYSVELETITAPGKFSGSWWIDTGDRVLSTIAQAALGVLTAAAVPGLLEVDLVAVLSISGLAGAIAFLKAVAVTRR